VIAFKVEPQTGALTEINRVATGGAGAPYLSVHPSGRWVAVAHYTSGHTSILPVRSDGGLSDPSAVTLGPNDSCMLAHEAVFSQNGKFLYVPCLDSNFVIQFKFNAGKLDYNDPPTVAVAGGPRHLSFDPLERFAYVVSETASTITTFAYDRRTGRLSDPQVSNAYQTTAGASAEIHVHPSGRFLYVSNRGENSIGLFSIDRRGQPHAVSFVTDMVARPRDFTIDPSGSLLISANQDDPQNLLVYRIAQRDGKLTQLGMEPVGGQPSFVGVEVLP
jgi:6-phosphogluconolactonase